MSQEISESSTTWENKYTFTPGIDNLRPSAFSPYGRYFAVGSLDDSVYIYENAADDTWSFLTSVSGIALNVWSAQFSNDSQYLAVGHSSGNLYKYNTNDWAAAPISVAGLTDHVGGLGIGLGWSNNDAYLAAPQRDGTVDIVDTSTWSIHTTLAQSVAGSSIYGTVFSPGGEYFAHASFDGNIYIYDFDEAAGTFAFNRTLSAGSTSHYACEWSNDGQYIAATTNSANIGVWRVSDWSFVTTLAPQGAGSTNRSYDCRFGPNSDYLMHGSLNGLVYIHDTSDWSVVRELGTADGVNVYGLSWQRTNDWLGYSKGTDAHLVDIETPAPVSGYVRIGGSPLVGAKITAINDTRNEVIGTTTTAADGTYAIPCPVGETVHVLMEYDDGAGTQYNAKSKPFIVAQ